MSEDGNDPMTLWRAWCNLWGGLMLLLIVVSAVVAGYNLATTGQAFEGQSQSEIIVVGTTSSGEDIVADSRWGWGDKLTVNLSQQPSEAGVSSLYLYELPAEDRVGQQAVDPLQTQVVFRGVELRGDYRLVAVDGSNQIVYSVTYSVREVEIAPF